MLLVFRKFFFVGLLKVVYIWISLDPAKAEPTLGGFVIVVVVVTICDFKKRKKESEKVNMAQINSDTRA